MGPACGASGTRFLKKKKKKSQAFSYSINEKWHPITPTVLHTSQLEKELIPVRPKSLGESEM